MAFKDLDSVWIVLATESEGETISAAPIGVSVSAGDILAGIDRSGRRHLLIPLLPGEAARTDTRGGAVHLDRVSQGSTHYLTVLSLLPELSPVFTQFCNELVSSIEDADSPARATADAFDRWRTLFADATAYGLLGEEAIVGLMGELLAVESLLRCGASVDLRFWVGPFDAVHDLRSLKHAIEVKSTLTREGNVISIASVDQLQPPPACDLILLHTRLERDPAGTNIADVVDRLTDAGAQQTALQTRLHAVGVGPDRLELYSDRRFRLVRTSGYDITGNAFPRIVRSSFIDGDIPPGTLRMKYQIDLTNEPPHPMDPATLTTALNKMAADEADLTSEGRDGLDP